MIFHNLGLMARAIQVLSNRLGVGVSRLCKQRTSYIGFCVARNSEQDHMFRLSEVCVSMVLETIMETRTSSGVDKPLQANSLCRQAMLVREKHRQHQQQHQNEPCSCDTAFDRLVAQVYNMTYGQVRVACLPVVCRLLLPMFRNNARF